MSSHPLVDTGKKKRETFREKSRMTGRASDRCIPPNRSVVSAVDHISHGSERVGSGRKIENLVCLGTSLLHRRHLRKTSRARDLFRDVFGTAVSANADTTLPPFFFPRLSFSPFFFFVLQNADGPFGFGKTRKKNTKEGGDRRHDDTLFFNVGSLCCATRSCQDTSYRVAKKNVGSTSPPPNRYQAQTSLFFFRRTPEKGRRRRLAQQSTLWRTCFSFFFFLLFYFSTFFLRRPFSLCD